MIVFLCFIFIDQIQNDCFFFINLERVSKRSRIMNFFRGRSRASDRTDDNIKERDHSQVTLIDKTSMK